MAVPWILGFSDEARALFTTFKRAAREGVSADSVYRFIKEQGTDIALSEVREIVGRLRFYQDVKRYIDELNPTTLPQRQFIPISGSNMIKRYRYTMSLLGRNTDSDELEERTVSLTTDTLLTKAEAIERMLDAPSVGDSRELFVTDDARVDFIERRA